MLKILVTGSNGLLGQKITERFLAKRDFVLVATSRGGNRFPVKDGYIYLPMDITDEAEVRQVIGSIKPDVVINTAAMANPDACESDRLGCDLVNIHAVQYLADSCKELDIHLVHLSTDFVFDGENGPYDENAAPGPLSYYGKSKLAGEQALEKSGCKWTIIRTILVYGVTGNLSRSNVVLWVKSSLEKQIPIRVVDDQWRMPTLAEDLAEACILAAMKRAFGLYHVSGNEMMSVLELARMVANFWKLDTSLISPVASASLEQPAKRPARTGFVLDKAVKILSYRPRSFVDGLAIVDGKLNC
ncbi:dTDP-4-dehydrorhamnose reductase [Hufsiella ginkgonis]|uniref:dTDP-4-dehydrorhamnose reductase n=1 Tax=Hufsiella ginkgonis TaxID=2695274 RepID=A0A7K1Y1Q8_9SPHI|nr:dTDP-4-dehydrorhamnose reductase [Hufsiella ginkgonis]MXV17175.1 dTDP-4-dehydrorhamnose reductase [Hufsiella ginkgonis]